MVLNGASVISILQTVNVHINCLLSQVLASLKIMDIGVVTTSLEQQDLASNALKGRVDEKKAPRGAKAEATSTAAALKARVECEESLMVAQNFTYMQRVGESSLDANRSPLASSDGKDQRSQDNNSGVGGQIVQQVQEQEQQQRQHNLHEDERHQQLQVTAVCLMLLVLTAFSAA